MQKFLIILFFIPFWAQAHSVHIGEHFSIRSIKEGLKIVHENDTLFVHSGWYKEGNIIIELPITLIGIDFPILDGENKFELLSIKSNHVLVTGFKIINSGFATTDDPCGIKIYDSKNVTIKNNILENNFFGIYLQYCKNCIVIDNTIKSKSVDEQQIGNGIHCWKSDSLQITHNVISGHRDGIYFEFVTNSLIWRNISYENKRYGLHFMFSNDDAYICNVFRKNGAGVAVMYTKKVMMFNNTFEDNWGDAAYGLLFKDISDSYLIGNKFLNNTTGLHMEGTSRIAIENNLFKENGWAVKISASCMDNDFKHNNFISNTFDAATNGSLVLNSFKENYWDKYEGYDLNKDQIGDIPFHPLSLYAVIIETMPSAMLLYRSFMITLLDKSEKILPSITPDNFIDESPKMKPYSI
ncbi:MAG: nitrous oxide reductase family maturation protein NosD [Saprospiraceae bacterium]|nr:nitrous oxide reductase family maturation protein NosD [Saprospiraceae bacterium]